ncbi:MAG: hypothetical protein AAGM22_28205 [Acidobacteriota bacterium]
MSVTSMPDTQTPTRNEVIPGDTLDDRFRLDTLQTLSAEECRRVYEGVQSLREHWIPRDPDGRPFYSLGISSYMDANNGRAAEYGGNAPANNEMLRAEFGWLYERQAAVLSEFLGRPCLYHEGFALPGFHIFQHDPDPARSKTSEPHYDTQGNGLDWSIFPGNDMHRQLSFTLSIRLPESGGGLLVWNLNKVLLNQMPQEEKAALIKANRQPDVVPYREGETVVHTGQFLHKIAKNKKAKDGDERITLQGHAVYTDVGWVLYW